jgi:hemoglobin
MSIRPFRTLFAAGFAAALLSAPVAAQQPSSLYQRLGGYDAVAAVSDDFLGRLASDPQFARFFGGHSTDSMTKLRQHVVEFLCSATGGPCAYTGRDMKTSHAGLGITGSDWDRMTRHLGATFDRFMVPAKEREEVVAALVPLKKDIVDKP